MSLTPDNGESEAEKIFNQLDIKDAELQENKEKYTFLSRKMRIYIFCLFLILSVAVDLEYGIFNSSVDYLQEDLNMSNAEYGLFISISFTGRIIGLVIFMFLLNLKHRKYTLIVTIFLNGSSYAFYQITSNSFILTFAKMFAAGNKVCGTIYRPVWIEQFGLSNYKSILFSLVQVVSSYGQIIGFNLGSLLFKENWRLGLLCILILMYIIAIGFLIVPGKFFFRSYMFYEDKSNEIEELLYEKNVTSIDEKSEKANDWRNRQGTIFIDEKKAEEMKRKTKSENRKSIKNRIIGVLKDSLSLIKNPIYVLCIILRSNITFILQIVHSYLKPYQEHSLYDSNEDLIVLFYNISSLASTAVGGLLSGIVTKKLGGYERKKSIYVVLIPEIITAITVGFLAFTKNFYVYNINLILFFCFISMGNPVLQGYLMKTIPKSIKGIGVGLDMIVSTFLGKIPGPIIYGALADKYEEENEALPWQICMCYFFTGVVIAFILWYFKNKEEVSEEESDKVTLEDHIVTVTAGGTTSDVNDLFNRRMSTMNKRNKTVSYKFRPTNNRKNTEIMLQSIFEENDLESDNDNYNDKQNN